MKRKNSEKKWGRGRTADRAPHTITLPYEGTVILSSFNSDAKAGEYGGSRGNDRVPRSLHVLEKVRGGCIGLNLRSVFATRNDT